ncbi:MAG: DUF2723 domain-containing protein [Bacteroidetes bacterium]|nr:MAG: DUF2723 domain-containing protein [Bacteroidota bacterium]
MAREKPLSYLTFGLLALLYLLTRARYVGYGDGLGFLYHATLGWDLATNATSHVLYNNLNHVLLSLLPGNPVSVLTLASVAYAWAALIVFYRMVRLLVDDPLAALMPVLVLGTSFTWWRQAVTIEVYAFNSLLVMLMMYYATADLIAGRSEHAYRVALFLGLALLAHIQNILFLPFLLAYLFFRPGANVAKGVRALGLFALIGGLLLIPPLLWDSHSLRAIFFDRQFQDEVLALNLMSLTRGSLQSVAYFAYNFHLFLPFLIHGWWLAWRQNRRLFWFFTLAYAPFWLFAMRYDVPDSYVFYLTSYLGLCFIGSLSFRYWHARWPQRWRSPRTSLPRQALVLMLTLALAPTVYYLSWRIAETLPQARTIAAPKAYKGGLRYYLWPGMEYATDPLQLARDIHMGTHRPVPDFERYPIAISYLKHIHALPEPISPPE